MATTVFINLNPDNWTEVSLSENGQISNITDNLIHYIEAEIKPSSSQVLGHHLTPHEILRYTLEPLSKIFMRSIRGKGVVALSPGLTFGAPLTEIKVDEILSVNQTGSVFYEILGELKIMNAHLSLMTEVEINLGDF